MTIEIGNIVTVVSKDSYLHGKQGEVVEIEDDGGEDGPVGVFFHKSSILYYCFSREERTIRFEVNELRVDDNWSVENRARMVYGSYMYHHLSELMFPFSPENDCMCEDCTDKSSKRIIVNIWGNSYGKGCV